jgi:VanZ family protein
MSAGRNNVIRVFMSGQETRISKKRGPRPSGAVAVVVRLHPDLIADLDGFCAKQADRPTRSAAIRDAIASFIRAGNKGWPVNRVGA